MRILTSFVAVAIATSTFIRAAEEAAAPTAKPAEPAKPAQPALSKEDAAFEARMQAFGKAMKDFQSARAQETSRALEALESKRKQQYLAELEKQASAVLKEFPDKNEPYDLLLDVVRESDPAKMRALIAKLSTKKTPEESRERIKGFEQKLALLGKPLEVKFKAIDGREVDLGALKGKVVLIDFWATWCAPCVAELPNVKALYSELHDKGFEIIGVSLDEDKDSLDEFIKTNGVPWPIYFDGQGAQSFLAQKYGIDTLPVMWLVNKAGNLADISATTGLPAKVRKLLLAK